MKKRLMFPQVVPKTKSIEAVQMYHAERRLAPLLRSEEKYSTRRGMCCIASGGVTFARTPNEYELWRFVVQSMFGVQVARGCEMPNGRSGGFYLKRSELEQLLSQYQGEAEVAKKPRKGFVTASELTLVLNRLKDDSILVEEQDYSWYIMQFSEFADWVMVDSKSPLYFGLRHYHAEWRKEWVKKHSRPSSL
jgi:hypothetical protein